jgi:hypothetical protein
LFINSSDDVTKGLVVEDSLSPLVQAINRQTEAFGAAVQSLSASLTDFSESRSISASDGVMRAVLKGLGEVGATRVMAERALEGVAIVEDRLVTAEGEARALRKDVR